MTRIVASVLTLARLAAAAILFVICASHWWATTARAAFDALPDYDFKGAAEAQRQAGHYGEALMIIDAGIDTLPGEKQAELLALQTRVAAERDDLLRRLREVGQGALTGRGDSIESLGGAIVTDMLVIGDLRDLVIEGTHALRGEDTDEVIVALSALGIATTAAPEADAGVAVLKFARRAGALGDALAHSLVRVAKQAAATRDAGALLQVAGDAARLAKAARPAAAMKILKLVDDPATLHLVADFAQRPGGAFALWLGGERSLKWLKTGGAQAQDWLLRAARRGEAGLDLLTRRGRLLLRPHPLLGLLKAIYSGAVPALLLELLESQADALFGIASGWLMFELVLLRMRFRNLRLRRERRAAALGDLKV
ncbi:MAG: hypothetical protein NVS9B10_24890 [Nevskia sp.]